jgi:acyl carrier protein
VELSEPGAGGVFIDWLFSSFGFEKLYAELPGFNYSSFASGIGKLIVEEGRLVRHEYSGGRWWDLHLLAIHREQWNAERKLQTKTRSDLPAPGSSGLDFDEMCSVLASELGFDPDGLNPDTRLVEDLGLDSVSHFELLLLLEELGADVKIETLSSLSSLSDVHFAYLQHRS